MYFSENLNLPKYITLSPILQDALHSFDCHLQHLGILHLWL